MNEQELQERLSVINTHWTLLRQAHGAGGDEAAQARAELMQRYSAPSIAIFWLACAIPT